MLTVTAKSSNNFAPRGALESFMTTKETGSLVLGIDPLGGGIILMVAPISPRIAAQLAMLCQGTFMSGQQGSVSDNEHSFCHKYAKTDDNVGAIMLHLFLGHQSLMISQTQATLPSYSLL